MRSPCLHGLHTCSDSMPALLHLPPVTACISMLSICLPLPLGLHGLWGGTCGLVAQLVTVTIATLWMRRSPKAPDATTDIGSHAFRYALFPHAGSWREAGVVPQAWAFNALPRIVHPATSRSFALHPACTSSPMVSSPLLQVRFQLLSRVGQRECRVGAGYGARYHADCTPNSLCAFDR